MPKARIETPSGAKISIEGTTEEVDRIISDYQRRENIFKQRRNYYMQASGATVLPMYDGETRQTPFLGERKQISPSEKVQELIRSGFFEKPRSLPEIRQEIRSRFKIFIGNSSLHPTLMSFIGKGILERTKKEKGLWYYTNKKEEKK